MNKIITLTESDIFRIVRQVISEEKEYVSIPKSGCETYKRGCDPFSYIKVVDESNNIKYYYKKETDKNWTQSKNIYGVASIQKNVTFNSKPELQSKLNVNPVSSDSKGIVKGTKMKLDKTKLVNGNYSIEELNSIVNSWKPTYDFNLQGKTESEKKIFDWKTNVDKISNSTNIWRNNQIKEIQSNTNLNNTEKKEAEYKMITLTNLVSNKLEKEYEERWEKIT